MRAGGDVLVARLSRGLVGEGQSYLHHGLLLPHRFCGWMWRNGRKGAVWCFVA
jgi:hypothetical protein